MRHFLRNLTIYVHHPSVFSSVISLSRIVCRDLLNGQLPLQMLGSLIVNGSLSPLFSEQQFTEGC